MSSRLLFIGDSRDIDNLEGNINAKEMAEYMASVGVTWQHFTGISGFIHGGQRKLHAYFSIDDENIIVKRDALVEYLREAHKRGIKIFLYLNVHWYPEGFLESHPNWLQVKVNGEPKTGLYNLPGSVTPCPNSSWRDWIFSISTKIAGKYDIDGFFLDGPVFFQDTCYCKSCREKFRSMFGEDLIYEKIENPKYKHKFIEFKYRSLGDFLKDFKSEISRVKPNILVYMNGGHPQANWHNGRDNALHVDYQDLIGAEGGFIGGRLIDPDNNFRRTSITSKFLEAAARGKPSVVFSDVAFKPWSAYPLTKAEVDLMVASIVANGSSPHFVYHYPNLKEKYYEYVKENYMFFRGISGIDDSESMAKAAILFSQTTADMLTGEQIPTDLTLFKSTGEMRRLFSYSLYGASEVLYRLHIPFDIIHERTAADNLLSKYSVIILPAVIFMSDRIAENIRNFSLEEGSIIADSETSLFTEDGEFRGNFGLADVFRSTFLVTEELPFYDYLYVPDSSFNKYIPTMPRKVRVKSDGKALAYFTRRRQGVYDKLTEPNDPAILMNRGNVYIAGNFFETYWAYRFPEYLSLFRKLMPEEAFILSESNLPGSVEVSFRRSREKVFMFLINYTGGMERPIREIVRLTDIKCIVKLKDVSKAFSHVLNETLDLREMDNAVEVRIPTLKSYDVIEFT
ncbi:beta-galactosidase [Candidatus Bathyarchaeota archaeon]|nr:beta-galactosidase [Candidatus Bathyarchaeota archaeon]